MFDIIIGLFGGLFYGGVLAKEKIENRIWEAEREKHEKTYRRITDALNDLDKDIDLENRYREYVYSGKYRDEIYDKLKEDLFFAFGEAYEDIFELPRVGIYITEQEERGADWAISLLMSKEGKLDVGHVTGHFIIPPQRSHGEEFLRLCQRIEENLRKFIPEVEFVFNARSEYVKDRRYNLILTFRHCCSGTSPDIKRLW